jgi:transcriptional regulator of acetoin/glycerol metabolism
LEKAAIESAGGCIEIVHVDVADGAPRVPPTPAGRLVLEVDDLSIEAVERSLVARVLQESGGNRSLAARTLGVHRATLYGKLRALGLAAG